jgi:fructokinase
MQYAMEPTPAAVDQGPIVGLGEALFDCFADHRTLGGAPLNAALAAHALGRPLGIRGQMVSRVGDDPLGKQILATLSDRDVDTSSIQIDPQHPTGTVQVEMVEGEPRYEIIRDVAWDYLQWNETLQELAARASGITFGSLAQRHPDTRHTIREFLQRARSAVKLFDVNLRGDFYDAEVIEASCHLADAIKLNAAELEIVCQLLQLENDATAHQQPSVTAAALRERFALRTVILTHGSHGTELITEAGSHTAPVPRFEPTAESDPVGAGDACGATCLLGMVLDWSPPQIVERANRVGAYVASRKGATPPLDANELLQVA